MSLSDCAKCWDTPCTCGWEYRNYSLENLEKLIRRMDLIIEFKEQTPNAKFSECMGDETEDDRKFMKFINES
ncbi:hypothetical protein LCGC14_2904380 [marine sediment metagenome]|uniref:Uncharacterized protein n=1 Tax=marine sediment metagenome TaxID=412755 RepID=A0A0F8XTZ5_9ZZZZ